MSDLSGYKRYTNQNADVIYDMIRLHGINQKRYRLVDFQISRRDRTMRNDLDGTVWDIPESYDLT